jgi:hypothetical protein
MYITEAERENAAVLSSAALSIVKWQVGIIKILGVSRTWSISQLRELLI